MSLTLYLLLLGPLRCSLAAAPCKEEEYPVGAECCPKCGPGYRVQEACGELTGTLCVPCDPGTYTAHLNGLSECLQCRVCDPAMGLVTRRQCSTTENTVCVCDQGHFCVSESGDDCAECRPHTACRPGQRVQQRGTEWQDRVCEDCPPETFSPSGTLEECQPWTRGTRQGETLTGPAGPAGRHHSGFGGDGIRVSREGPAHRSTALGGGRLRHLGLCPLEAARPPRADCGPSDSTQQRDTGRRSGGSGTSHASHQLRGGPPPCHLCCPRVDPAL
ncbi:tumor necrosis factor receptor superfamily member 14 isoform X1 [Lynx canadensis]|uniref:tumor necrosis factor receptor superfamily member 14 isoform X1 n=1 Tax=Lynx canadensis TaxID=61383 RepID=UPI0011B01A0B|nr:tumor necrosis factor receptor superfamily member 14 isoform X1 [Lynx canadensis]